LSHLICSCCSIRLLSVVPFFNCFCYSCLHYISYICVCYRKLLYYITYHNTSYLFNHSMCCISYHHVTLCDLHPHPYYTIHHHQHSHQLTLKLWNEFDWHTLTDTLWPTHFDRHFSNCRCHPMNFNKWRQNNFLFHDIVADFLRSNFVEGRRGRRGGTRFWPVFDFMFHVIGVYCA
jgi:hypothetical protein